MNYHQSSLALDRFHISLPVEIPVDRFNPTVLFFNATLPTHPKPVSFTIFFQHFTKTLTCIFLAKRNLVFF